MIEEQLYKMLTDYFASVPLKVKPEIYLRKNLSTMGWEAPFQGPPQEFYSIEVNFSADCGYLVKSGKVEVKTIAGTQRLLGFHVHRIKNAKLKLIFEARGIYDAMEHLILDWIEQELEGLWT